MASNSISTPQTNANLIQPQQQAPAGTEANKKPDVAVPVVEAKDTLTTSRLKAGLTGLASTALGHGALALAPSPLWAVPAIAIPAVKFFTGTVDGAGFRPTIGGTTTKIAIGAGLAGAAALGATAALPLAAALGVSNIVLAGVNKLSPTSATQGWRGLLVGALVGTVTTLALSLGPVGFALTHLAQLPGFIGTVAALTGFSGLVDRTKTPDELAEATTTQTTEAQDEAAAKAKEAKEAAEAKAKAAKDATEAKAKAAKDAAEAKAKEATDAAEAKAKEATDAAEAEAARIAAAAGTQETQDVNNNNGTTPTIEANNDAERTDSNVENPSSNNGSVPAESVTPNPQLAQLNLGNVVKPAEQATQPQA